MRAEQIAARDDARSTFARRSRDDDGQTSHVRVHHVIRRFAKRVVLVHHHRVPATECSRNRASSRRSTRVEQIAARDDTEQIAVGVEHRKALVRRVRRSRRQPLAHLARPSASPWIVTTSRDAPSRTSTRSRKSAVYSVRTCVPRRASFSVMIELRMKQQRDQIRGAAAREQRQQPHRLPRRLEREHDRREQRVRRAGEDRRHADERRDVKVDARVRRDRRSRRRRAARRCRRRS